MIRPMPEDQRDAPASFSGRTPAFDAGNRGSNPRAGANQLDLYAPDGTYLGSLFSDPPQSNQHERDYAK